VTTIMEINNKNIMTTQFAHWHKNITCI